ncbi:MAG: hypothetical protein WBE48_05790 [Xanthobacteraceae bacterium]
MKQSGLSGAPIVAVAIAGTTFGGLLCSALVFRDLILRSLTSIRELSDPVLPLAVFMMTLPVRKA